MPKLDSILLPSGEVIRNANLFLLYVPLQWRALVAIPSRIPQAHSHFPPLSFVFGFETFPVEPLTPFKYFFRWLEVSGFMNVFSCRSDCDAVLYSLSDFVSSL